MVCESLSGTLRADDGDRFRGFLWPDVQISCTM